MSLRTTERIFITSSLALMLAAGCGDGDHPPATDAGGVMDASRPKDAGRDAGQEEELPSRACGTKTCTGAIVSQTTINPCCVEETNACGLNADDLRRANSSTPFTGCVPKDVEAAVENSVYCGEFWDQVEMVKKANGGLDIASGAVTLTFDGCCLPTGECGALINTPRNGDPEAINTHLGCVSFGRLQAAFAAEDAGTMETPAKLPFCNPSTGEPPTGTETVVGVPKFVCGCGAGNLYDPTDVTRTFQCLNNLPTTVCGKDDPSDAILAMVPEFICGCSTDSKLPCMTNVDKAVCGKKEIDANSAELARIPSFICGGTAQTDAAGLPALKGVDAAVCGKKTPTAADLAMVPQFICGVTGNPDTSTLPKLKNTAANVCGGLAITNGSPYIAQIPEFLCGCPANPTFPCLRNVGTTVCGGKAITTGATELATVPEFVCGCGADTVDPHTGLPCLSHVEGTVCGAKSIDATSTEIATVAEFVCGCGADTIDPRTSLPCFSHVENTVCGGKQIDASSAELAAVPEFICGAVGLTSTPSLPVLRNVENTVCGGKQIDANSAELALIPQFICGKDNNPDTSSLPKMTGVDTAVCGTKVMAQNSAELAAVPEFICGAVNNPDTSTLPKLRNVDTSICGSKQITTGATELTQLPVFICGLIGSTDTSGLPRLRNVEANVCGTAAVAAGSPFLGLVPKFMCGCTNSLALELGCMRNVDYSVCGALTPPAALLANVPEFICGCGESTKDAITGSVCMSFVAATTCGSKDTVLSTRAALGGAACLAGVPEYAFGCGDNASPSATNPCLRNAGTVANTPGCVDVTPSDTTSTYGLRRVPEYLCGCGPTNAYTGATDPDGPLPCLNFVDKAICGTIAIPVAAVIQARLPTLPASFCGCGDGQLNSNVASLPCIPNVPLTFCAPGALPVNPTGGPGSTPCVVGYPAAAPGCGATTTAPSYPIQCIPNSADPGCN